jgi:superfamily I DNA/RNA helicase
MEGKNLDLTQKGVKVLTLNSAKGLEFPIVALAGFTGSPTITFPSPSSIKSRKKRHRD